MGQRRRRSIAQVAAGVALAVAAAPAVAQDLLPRDGRSLGGNWRAAPSVDGERIGGLADGTRLTILENAGTTFNGYDWFAVEVNGRRGFQWGGILCSDGARVPGVLEVCPGTAAATPPPPAMEPAPAAVQAALEGFHGDWTPIAADTHGLRPGSCLPGADSIMTIAAGNLVFHESRCALTEAVPEAGGVRLTGTCTGEGETWPFDRLAFLAEAGGLIAMVDRTQTGGGDLVVYRGCWLPE